MKKQNLPFVAEGGAYCVTNKILFYLPLPECFVVVLVCFIFFTGGKTNNILIPDQTKIKFRNPLAFCA